jgi:hypothetical protein
VCEFKGDNSCRVFNAVLSLQEMLIAVFWGGGQGAGSSFEEEKINQNTEFKILVLQNK